MVADLKRLCRELDIDDVVEDFYVSAIQVCTVDESSIGIVGIQITMTSV